MAEYDLLPCPFCGSEPEQPYPRQEGEYAGWWQVRCNACLARVYAYPTAEAVVTEWNRRDPEGIPDDALAQEVLRRMRRNK